MKTLKTTLILLLHLVVISTTYGQTVTCNDCPIPFQDNVTNSSFLDVAGIPSGSELCEVTIEFTHTWLTEVEIVLIAPDGSNIDLVQNDPGGSTPNCNWDITYLACDATVTPDPGYPDEFTSTDYNNGNFTGSYYPGNGCFSDFTGSYNGTWELQAIDLAFADIGEVTTWGMVFCGATCEADGGATSINESTYCEGDEDLLLDITIDGQNTDAAYGYTFAISDITGSVGPILEYSDNPDLTDFGPGVYNLCGFSYLLEDQALITPVDGTNTATDLLDDIDASVFCGDLNEFCINIIITEAPTITFEGPTEVCAGVEYIYTITDWDPAQADNYGSSVQMGGISSLLQLDNGEFSIIWNDSSPTGEFCGYLIGACGLIQDCVIVTINPEPQPLNLIYETTACIGQLLTITWDETSGNTYDAIANSGSFSDFTLTPGTLTYIADSDEPIEICIEETSECGTLSTCANIIVAGSTLTNETAVDTCGPDFDLVVYGDGLPVPGNWVQISGPSSTTFDTPNNSVTAADAPALGIYIFEFTADCGGSIEVTIELTQDLESPDETFECQPGGGYIVTIPMTPDLGPYLVNGEPVTSDIYVSEVIFAPTQFFVVSSELGCRAWVFSVTPDCPECSSDGGTISITDQESCDLDDIVIISDDNANLDTDDAGVYIVYTDPLDTLGSIVFVSTSVNIPYSTIFSFGTTYYVTYVVGNASGSSVDFTDPCLDFSNAVSFQFIEPIIVESITVTPLESCGLTWEAVVVDNWAPNGTWFVSDLPPGQSVAFSSFQEDITLVTFSDPGTYVIEYFILNGNCSVTVQETIVVTDGPQLENLLETCIDESSYLVSFNISGGTAPYSVNGVDVGSGPFISNSIPSGETYSFTVIDANNCEIPVITGIQICECETDAGTMNNFELQVCGDELVQVLGLGDEITDDDDNVIYILHTSSGNTLGTILHESTTGSFVFAAPLVYGTTYYISTVVGNGLATSVDLNDPCLSVANGQPITFYEEVEIIAIVLNPDDICTEIFNLEANTNTSIPGIWSVVDSPPGSMILFTEVEEDVTSAMVDTPGVYSIQYSIINGPCSTFDTITFNYMPGPELISPVYICDASNGSFQVSFTIEGGAAPYALDGNELAGSSFISDLIPSGESDTFQIVDANGCLSDTLIASYECDLVCVSESGSMPSDTVKVCGTDTICIANNLDAILESDDVGYFVLHTRPDSIIGSIQSISFDGKFINDSGLSYNIIYYVSYVVGDSLADGSLDFNDQCLSVSDGQPIVFLQKPIIGVGQDLEICALTTELQATINDESIIASWHVVAQPNDASVNFTQILDTATTVSVDRPGEYILSYNTSTNGNICFGGDTLQLTVFKPIIANVIDYNCNFDTDTYIATLQLDGGNGTYLVNGSSITDSLFVSSSIPSGTEVQYVISDSNVCDSIIVEVLYDCNCPSDPGTLSDELVTACTELDITITPTLDANVGPGDSLVYILHQSPGTTILDFIATSVDGTFSFDPNTMSSDEVYYISAVVFSGGVFTVSTLEEDCTIVSNGTPVSWSLKNRIVAFADVIACQDEPILIGLTYEGEVPATLTISTGGGTETVVIVSEGYSEYLIDIQFSTILTPLNLTTATNCSATFDGTWDVLIVEQPSLVIQENIEICNVEEEGSMVTLDDLIISSSLDGNWTDLDGNPVTNILDFDGQPIGSYQYIYTTTGNTNSCPETSDTTTIIVEDCSCPTIDFVPFEDLCQGQYTFNLDEYLNSNDVGSGVWSIDGTDVAINNGNTLVLVESNIGTYTIIYTLTEVPDGCEPDFSFSFNIAEQLNAGIAPSEQINLCIGDLEDISLFNYIEDYDTGGEWITTSGLTLNPETGIVNLANADIGLFSFNYIIPANGSCEERNVLLKVLIEEPIELLLSLIDPLCFGQADGSVAVFDQEGNPLSGFDLTLENGTQANSENLAAGDYQLTYPSEAGCPSVENFTLEDPLELFLDIGDDIEVPVGQITTITPVLNVDPQEISLYEWFINQANANASTFDTLFLSPDDETLVELIITDEDGCITSDDLLITVIEDKVDVIMPNIFNPSNGAFSIPPFEAIQLVNDFIIYNRWGERIFAAKNYDPRIANVSWNGTFNGAIVGPGVYVYRIEYLNASGENIILFGDITVL